MSGLSYDALLQGIRTEPFSGSAAEDPQQQQPNMTGSTLREIFDEGVEGAATPEEPREPPRPLFDLPLARAASGWGAIGGLVLGIAAGANGGAVSLVTGIAIGIPLGSLAGIACLILFAGAVERFGPAWAMILTALGIVLGMATLRL